MTTDSVSKQDIPDDVLAMSSLPDADYIDMFTRSTSAVATPEQWARAMFGDVPTPGERFIWRGLLGFRLSRGKSPETVAGWQVAERGADWIRLEATSSFLTGNLVIRAADGQVSLTTFLRYDRTVGGWVWPPLSAVHRSLAPWVLRSAEERIEQERPSD